MPTHNLPSQTWKSLNRLRTLVSRSKESIHGWGYGSENACLCAISPQTMADLLSLRVPTLVCTCTREDVYMATANVVSVPNFWFSQIKTTWVDTPRRRRSPLLTDLIYLLSSPTSLNETEQFLNRLKRLTRFRNMDDILIAVFKFYIRSSFFRYIIV